MLNKEAVIGHSQDISSIHIGPFVRLTDTTASLFRFASETNLERDVAAVMSSSLWCKMSILAAALQIAALLKRVVSE